MDWSKPKPTTGLDVAFGPKNLSEFLPKYGDIPAEFGNRHNPYVTFISTWFYQGLTPDQIPAAKEGIDRGEALSHLKTILGSFEPKHEHKVAGCAYLASLWLETPKV